MIFERFLPLADASLDLPKGPAEESCKIDMEPTLEAGVPSVEIEGLQGDAPDLEEVDVSAEKPEFHVSGPQVDKPEAKLKTQVSGPNVYSNIDLNDPPSGLNLPSSKTKRGKCFSCMSGGDKDEPYSKGKANAGLDFDRSSMDGSIDMKTDGKIGTESGPDGKGLRPHAMGPNVSVSSTSARRNFSGPSVEGEDIEMNPNVQLHSDSPGIDRPEGNLKTGMSAPDVDVSTIQLQGAERKAGIPSSDLDLAIKKKKRGNCFSCAGVTDKEEPYKKRKGNGDFDFNRPDVDGSMEMRDGDDFDISGTHNNLGGDTANLQSKKLELHASAPDVDISKSDQQNNIEFSGPDVSLPSPYVSAKVPERLDGERINAPHIDTRGEEMKPKISGLDVDVPAGKRQGHRAQFDHPSATLDASSTKKKHSSCFSCAGNGEKDDSYKKTKGDVGYDFSGPDGSLEMKNVDNFDLNRSGPDFEESGMSKEFRFQVGGPDFEVNGENRGISPGATGIEVNTRGPEINAPDVSKPSGKTSMGVSGTSINNDVDFDVSGPDPSLSRTQKVDLHTNTPNIDTPEAKVSTQMSGPDVDASTRNIRDPKARLDVPSADLNFSSSKKKRGNCLSCTGGLDKDEPYRKTKEDAQFGLNGPGVQGSTNGSDLDIDTEKPSLGFDANAPELKKKGKIRAETSRPEVDVPSGNTRDPKTNFIGPSADLPPPSGRKPRGNCLSCKGNVDKDEPYRRAQGNTQFDFDGQDVNGSLELEKPAISKPNTDSDGRATGPEFDIDTPDIDVSAQKPRSGFKSPEFDVPKASGERAIDIDGPEFSYNKPNISGPTIGKTDKGIGNPSLNTPDMDASVNTPETGVKSPEFRVPKLGASAEIDARANVDTPDLNISKGKIQTEISQSNADVPSGDFRGPDANIQVPSADFPSSSKKKTRRNCLSCTGGADKDEPYRRTKGNSQFDIDGPNLDGSVETKTSGIRDPKIDIDGTATGPEFDLDTPDIDVSARKPSSGLASPEFDVPNARSTRDIDFNGPSLSYNKPKISEPSPEFNVPKARGERAIDIDGPEFSYNKPNISGPTIGKTDKGIGNPSLNTPDMDASVNTPETGVKSPEFRVPKLGASAEIDARANVDTPDLNISKGKIQTEISQSNADVPSGDFRGPDANIQVPSADFPSSSKKKTRRNCLSCTGGADKDEPYRRTKGNSQFDIDGPNLDGSVETKTSGIRDPKIDIDGTATGPEFDLDTPDIDVSARKPSSGLASPEFDVPNARSTRDIDFNGPSLSYNKPKISEPSLGKTNEGINIPGSNRSINNPDIDASVNTPDAGLDVAEFGAPALGALAEIGTRPNVDAPDFNTSKGKLQTEISKPNVDVPSGDVRGPDANIQVPSADLHSSSKRKHRGNCLSCTGAADKDEPYRRAKGNSQFDIDGPNRDGSVEMKGIGEPKVWIDGGATGQKFDISTPDIDISSTETEIGLTSSRFEAPKSDGLGGIDIAGPDLSYGKPKISGPSLEKTEEFLDFRKPDFGINTPDIETTGKPNTGFNSPGVAGLDIPKIKGAGQKDLNGAELFSERPALSLPSIGQKVRERETPRLDLDTDTPQGPGDVNTSKLDTSVSFKDGDITLNTASSEDFDVKANLPDREVSNIKRGFGHDRNGFDIDIPGVENKLEVESGASALHSSECKPTIGLDMNGLDTGDVDFDLHRPDLDVASNQRYGVDLTGLDTPDSDNSFPPIDDKEESCEPLEIKDDKGKDFDAKFNWGINTSTPKAPEATKQLIGPPRGEINLVSSPVEDEISVVNTFDTLDLYSTPEPVPATAFHEPHSLQRYDEIRPEMELRLLPPTEMTKADQSFEFGIQDRSDDNAKNSWKPGSMKLVKVEENITVCSASVDENESHSPRNRTLTLDREIRHKIEVEFPKEEKQKRSSSSSSSSSSDSDGQKEEKPKRNKKSRLLKAFRKSSSSSASSKEGHTSLKQKEKEPKLSATSSSSDDEEGKRKKSLIKRDVTPSSREGDAPSKQDNRESKQSTSSSSSDEEDVGGKKRPSKDDVLLVKTTEQKKTRTPSASSSSDEEPSFLHGKGVPRRKSSKSSSSSDKENRDGEKQFLLPQTIFGKKELKEPAPSFPNVKEDMPTVVFRSVKPVSDFHVTVDRTDGDVKPKERKSSTSSSSDEESKSPLVYEVEDRMLQHQQQSVLEPESGHEKAVVIAADTQEGAPEDVLHSAEPNDPEFMFTLDARATPKGRKSSSSSSSSLDSVKHVDQDLSQEKTDDEMKPKEWKGSMSSPSDGESRSPVVFKVQYTTYQQRHPQGKNDQSVPSVEEFQEDSPEEEWHSVSPTNPDLIFRPDFQANLKERKSSASSSSSSDVEPSNVNNDPETTDVHDPKSVLDSSLTQRYFVSYDIKEPDYPQKTETQLPSERKSSTSSSSEDSSHSLDLAVYRYETVHHVIAPDYPPTEQEPNSSDVRENSFVVVSRSFKKPSTDIWDTTGENQNKPEIILSSADVQFSELPNDSTYQLEYPFNHPKGDEDKSTHIQEEGIVPVFKSPTVDHDNTDLSAQLEALDEDGTVDRDSTWDIHVHTFETVYQVTIPDSPSTDENTLEIQELAPTVVTRSVKRTSPVIENEYDNLEVEPQVSTRSTELQFSEPSNDFEIEYPKNGKVLTTDEPQVTLTDEEWIMKHKVEKESPDISALLAVLDHPNEEAQQSSDLREKTEEETSPHEESPKDIVRRGSSSRLWELMQGYLIETPIASDGGANSVFEPEKSVQKEEPKVEITESVSTVESRVPVLNQQTETIQSQHASNIVTYKMLIDEPSQEMTTSITKVERSVSEVKPTVSKFDPINFQVHVGDKTPVVKEHTTSHWRKQISVPVDVDDDEDPWMRHYSKGLQRATSYQVMSTKSPESETSFAQSRSLSLSKVPHVKGVKTSTEKERERTRYSIESRTRTEPTVYRVTTERRPLLRDLEAVPRVRTNENVFSIKGGKSQSPKTQTETTKEESPRGSSGSGASVQSLRSLWNK